MRSLQVRVDDVVGRTACTTCARYGRRIGSVVVAVALAFPSLTCVASARSYAADEPLVGTWQNIDNPRWKLTLSHPAGQSNKLKLEGAYPQCDEITTTGSDTTAVSTDCTGTARKCKFSDHPSLKLEGDTLSFTYNMLSLDDDGSCRVAHKEQTTTRFKLVSRPGAAVTPH